MLAADSGGVVAPHVSVAPVTLFSRFEHDPPMAVEAALPAEIRTIMAPMGLRFQWRSLSDGPSEVAVELAVLTFKGRCDAEGLVPFVFDPGPLGWTHVSDGAILPFSDMDCDRIRGFLQKDL